MIGKVASGRATVPISLRGPSGNVREVEALVDTGFTGDLVMPGSLVNSLQLASTGVRTVTLADGSQVTVPAWVVEIDWGGQWRQALCLEAGGEVLLGMSLLADHRLTVDVRDGGDVTVRPLG